MSDPTAEADRIRRFEALYDATYADVLRFVQRRAAPAWTDPSRSEDVVAETFLVAWRRLGDLPDDPDDARAWVFGVARHVLLNQRRDTRRRQALGVRLAEHAAAGSAADPADHAEAVATRVDVARAWRLLTEVHQEALALAALDGLDGPHAARVLGISPVAYRLRLSRARRALAAHLAHLPGTATSRPATPAPEAL